MKAMIRSLNTCLRYSIIKKPKKPKDPTKVKLIYEYDPNTAIKLTKAYSWAAFNESVDVCIKLGINPKRSEQTIRGSCVLPGGVGISKKICFFGGTPEEEKIAQESGADMIGNDQTLEDIKKEKFDFEAVYCTTTAISKLKSVARILGPKGLFPNVKVKTLFPPEEISFFSRRQYQRCEKRQNRFSN